MWHPLRAPAAILAAALPILAACGPGTAPVEEAIRNYCAAVQDQDLARLTCLSAGARETDPDTFHAWVESQYAAYLDGRDRGRVDVESGGIAMVKTFSIGRGTYYTVDQVRPVGDGAVQAVMTLTFGYGAIDLSGLQPGTTFYVAGAPPGRVHPIVIPRESEQIERTVLTSLGMVWTLVRQEPAGECGPVWAVNTVELEPDSARTTRLEWLF